MGNVSITIDGSNLLIDIPEKTGFYEIQKKSIPLTEVLVKHEANQLFINGDGSNYIFDNTDVIVPAGAIAEDKMDALLSLINIAVSSSTFGDNSSDDSIPANTSSVLLKTANTKRKEVIIVNNSDRVLWIRFESPAILDRGIKLNLNETHIEDRFRGAIYGIWDSGVTGTGQITEVNE